MTVRRVIALTSALACVTALSACSSPTPPAAPAPRIDAPTRQPPATEAAFAAAVLDATYPIDTTSTGKAPLKDGVYEEAVADSSAINSVRLDPKKLFGDLDGDSDLDAVTVLLASPGGSGNFTYIAAVLNDNGAARPLPATLVGDRVSVNSMDIVDGEINIGWLDRRPDEPMTTVPTVETHRTYRVRDSALVPSPPKGGLQAQ